MPVYQQAQFAFGFNFMNFVFFIVSDYSFIQLHSVHARYVQANTSKPHHVDLLR